MRSARPRKPKVPPMFTILPDRCFCIVGVTARMVRKQPFMFSSITSSNASGVVSHAVVSSGPRPPATLTRMSMRPPKASRVFFTIASTSAASVTSHFASTTFRLNFFTSSVTGAIAAMSRPARQRSTPSFASASVIAAPMPLAGPVTIATFPFSPSSIRSSH